MRAYQCEINRRRLYGISPEEFDELVALQEGQCAICRGDEPGGKGNWHVDHDHETGRIRGLLCGDCNLGLGKFRDRPDLLELAAAYLRR